MPVGVYLRTEKAKKNMSLSHKGIKMPETHRNKLRIIRTGWKLTEETKRKISENHKKKHIKPPPRKGVVLSEEIKRKMSASHRGVKWEGHVYKTINDYRHSNEWHGIRKQIYKRDNWICQVCGIKCHGKIKIQCHHIVPYRVTQDNSESNLITLCAKCHMKEEKKYHKKLNEQQEFSFLRGE